MTGNFPEMDFPLRCGDILQTTDGCLYRVVDVEAEVPIGYGPLSADVCDRGVHEIQLADVDCRAARILDAIGLDLRVDLDPSDIFVDEFMEGTSA